MTRVLGISGSLRRGSYNTLLLVAAAEVLPPDTELVRWQDLKAVPPFDVDDEGPARPPAVADLAAAVDAADAVLIATPEYNATVPGQLKNAVDWLSRPLRTNPLRGKPVAVVGASTGMFGTVGAQADLRKALARLGARVLETGVAVPNARDQFDEVGRLRSEEVRGELADVLVALRDEARPRVAHPVAA